MKGFRFYAEFDSKAAKRKGEDNGNVFAMMLDNNGRPLYIPTRGGYVEGIGAVFHTRNSGVAGTSASLGYLRAYGKRVSETKAREIHPAMFRILDGSK